MNILETNDLKKYYETENKEVMVKALDGISLSVQKGEFLSIVGTSGSPLVCLAALTIRPPAK